MTKAHFRFFIKRLAPDEIARVEVGDWVTYSSLPQGAFNSTSSPKPYFYPSLWNLQGDRDSIDESLDNILHRLVRQVSPRREDGETVFVTTCFYQNRKGHKRKNSNNILISIVATDIEPQDAEEVNRIESVTVANGFSSDQISLSK